MESEIKAEVREAAEDHSVAIEHFALEDGTLSVTVDEYVHDMWETTFATFVSFEVKDGIERFVITDSSSGEEITYTAEEIEEQWTVLLREVQDNLQQLPDPDENDTETKVAEMIAAVRATPQQDDGIVEDRSSDDA
jgi:hypothetical protein